MDDRIVWVNLGSKSDVYHTRTKCRNRKREPIRRIPTMESEAIKVHMYMCTMCRYMERMYG